MKSASFFGMIAAVLFLLSGLPGAVAQQEHLHAHGEGIEAATAAPQQMPCAQMAGMPCPHCPKMTGVACPHCIKGDKGSMPCPHCPKMTGKPCAGHSMHAMQGSMLCQPHGHGKMPGAMMEKMDRELFLDRKDELGLSREQVERLEAIRTSCREDNMALMAEVRSARLKLAELLRGDWSLEEAEKLVRKSRKLEADMAVRHLKSKKDAESVLTAQQLERVRQGSGEENLEDLFR